MAKIKGIGMEHFSQVHNDLLQNLLETTKAASQDPMIVERLLKLSNRALGYLSDASPFTSARDILDRWPVAVDAVDRALEAVDGCLDILLGHTAVLPESSVVSIEQDNMTIMHSRNTQRPQDQWRGDVDNGSRPFVPKLRAKPHAKTPLCGDGHPYAHEIQTLNVKDFTGTIECPSKVTEKAYEWIDKPEGLRKVVQQLCREKVIGVDLEHHSYRSYNGFTCLVQLSSPKRSYLLDALQLRTEMECLNHVFADPTIVKVFHGADSDIVWLQRDFGVYVVNMFDTHQAGLILKHPSHSLAFLLQQYCDVHTNKAYQLADWRIRPLPEEMKTYAVTDTYYLPYLFSRLREEAIAANALDMVLHKSNEVALKVATNEPYDYEGGSGSQGWRRQYLRFSEDTSTVTFAVFRDLHRWRDQAAREEDESLRYILPNLMLHTIARAVPTDASGVLACCKPVPPAVRKFASDITLVVRNAVEEYRPCERRVHVVPSTPAASVLRTRVQVTFTQTSLFCSML